MGREVSGIPRMSGETRHTGVRPRIACTKYAALPAAILLVLGSMAMPAGGEAHDDDPLEDLSSRIAILVERLGAEAWRDRERALIDLVEIGEPAVPLLTAAKSNPDLEVVWRAEVALERISRECTVESLLRPSRWKDERGDFILLDPPMEGLRAGDRFLALDGRGIRNLGELESYLLPEAERTDPGKTPTSETDRLTVLGAWTAQGGSESLRIPKDARDLTIARDMKTWTLKLGFRIPDVQKGE